MSICTLCGFWLFLSWCFRAPTRNRHPALTVTLCGRNLRLFRLYLSLFSRTLFLFVVVLCCHPSALFLLHSSVVVEKFSQFTVYGPSELDFEAVSLLLLAGDVALNPGPTTPLHDYTTSRLHHFTTTPLHDYTTSRLHHFTTTPLHDYTTSRLHHFTTWELAQLVFALFERKDRYFMMW